MRTRRRWWTVYALCATLLLAGQGWITHLLIEGQRAEARSREEAAYQSRLRQALWRMDSWLGPLLAREAARPFYDYQAWVPSEGGSAGTYAPAGSGAASVPSPLRSFHADAIRLHFEVDENGRWSSPQATAADGTGPPESEAADRALAELGATTDLAELRQLLDASERLVVSQSDGRWIEQCQALGLPAELALAQAEVPQLDAEDLALNAREFGQRRSQVNQYTGGNEAWVNRLDGEQNVVVAVRSGPLVPVWLGRTGEASELAFVRRVASAAGERVQGFLMDWPVLERKLLAEVADLLPEARLLPCGEEQSGAFAGYLLATLPAALVAPPASAPQPWLSAAARWSIVLPWSGLLLALAAAGATLRSSIETAERRSRFASSVTHELRTPLTTFRMYSEMLAKGMVPDERRADYYRTLEQESLRLGDLVESVLAYSRLEEGRLQRRRERVSVAVLLERTRAELERRAALAGAALQWECEADPELELETDPGAVHQILFNLVDNACKYGAGDKGACVRLRASATAAGIAFEVADDGPGIPRGLEERVFEAFERGRAGQANGRPSPPGLGLGLGLARGLARDLGGEVELARRERGACFVVHLPLA